MALGRCTNEMMYAGLVRTRLVHSDLILGNVSFHAFNLQLLHGYFIDSK